jgi:hypothetical protein
MSMKKYSDVKKPDLKIFNPEEKTFVVQETFVKQASAKRKICPSCGRNINDSDHVCPFCKCDLKRGA